MLLDERFLGLPEDVAVHLVRRAVRLVVEHAIAAALAGLEVEHSRRIRGLLRGEQVEEALRQVAPVGAVVGLEHVPAVGLEPVFGTAVNNGTGGAVINAEVVPVDQKEQVVQAQAPGGVLGLVAGTGREAAFAFEGDDLDFVRAGALQRQRLTGGSRQAVTGRAGVPLEEERLAFHLGVTGEAAVATEAGEVFLPHGKARIELVPGVPGLRVLDAEGFIENGERGIHQRNRVAGGEDEAVAKSLLGMTDIPAEAAAKQQGDERLHLGARTARVAALAEVDHEIDVLIDHVLDLFPLVEVGGQFRVLLFD